MDSDNAVALIMFTGESGKYSIFFKLFVCSFYSSSFQDQVTVPIPFGIRSFPPIVATTLEMIGSILSGNMNYSEKYEHGQSYQLCLMIHHSQIQLALRIPLLNIVFVISYPLELFRKRRVYF